MAKLVTEVSGRMAAWCFITSYGSGTSSSVSRTRFAFMLTVLSKVDALRTYEVNEQKGVLEAIIFVLSINKDIF